MKQAEVNRGGGRFCSRRCSGIAGNKKRYENKQPNVPNVECAFCGTPFYKKKNHMANSKSGLFFCCRKHKDLAQRIGGIKAIQPNHYGSNNSSYRALVEREKGFNACEKCGWDIHPEILEVHHRDRDKSNNTIENLEVLCPNCHMWEHYQSGDGKFWKMANSIQPYTVDSSRT